MSKLTLDVLGIRPVHRRAGVWAERMAQITDRLVAEYGVPTLGNYDDPIEEIFYIVLSARTAEWKYVKTHRALKAQYPRVAEIAAAPIKDIARCIRAAGLANKRAAQIKTIAETLHRQLGHEAADRLREMTAEQSFQFLTSLPGVGPKSALCVMMYSLGWDVFPVDVHARRVATRLGVLPRGLDHTEAQRRLPKYVPVGKSKELHVALVVHGRTICRDRWGPKCDRCPVADLCNYGRQQNEVKTYCVGLGLKC